MPANPREPSKRSWHISIRVIVAVALLAAALATREMVLWVEVSQAMWGRIDSPGLLTIGALASGVLVGASIGAVVGTPKSMLIGSLAGLLLAVPFWWSSLDFWWTATQGMFF